MFRSLFLNKDLCFINHILSKRILLTEYALKQMENRLASNLRSVLSKVDRYNRPSESDVHWCIVVQCSHCVWLWVVRVRTWRNEAEESRFSLKDVRGWRAVEYRAVDEFSDE